MKKVLITLICTLFFLCSAASVTAMEKINLNTATLEQQTQLPGVGPALAKRIIEYRTEHPFKTTEEVKQVKGIGDAKYEKIKDLITVQ